MRLAPVPPITVAVFALLTACSTARPSDDGDADVQVVDVRTDVESPDVGQDPSVEIIEDTAPDLADVPTGGDVGEPCDEDRDCETGFCADLTPGEGGGVCTQLCVDDSACPRDFDCVLLSGEGADVRRICLPDTLCVDPDGDGHGVGPDCAGRDCDETAANVNGSADEVCDGVDNDCDGTIDEDPRDAGQDCDTGFAGLCAAGRSVCIDGLLDCEARQVATDEVCDGIDNDCDGAVDEGEDGGPLSRSCYDGDTARLGIGVCTGGVQTCNAGAYSACLGQVLATPESCNDLDDDCDGESDEGLAVFAYYPDADSDSFGDALAAPTTACARPAGFVENRGDCDDTTDAVRPGAGEIPGDGVDQNCDGTEFCFEDADDDGYPASGGGIVVSTDVDCDDSGEAPAGAAETDCDDRHADAFPGNPEVCDGLDNDCNLRTDDGAGCYPNGQPCVDASDCASALCEEGVCARVITCVEDGSCPARLVSTAGGGRGTSERFQLELSAPTGPLTPAMTSERFQLDLGPTPYTTDP